MSKQIFDSLTPEQQQLVEEAARETVLFAREQANQRAQNRIDILKTNDTEILEVSAAMRAEMVELSRSVYDDIRGAVGDQLVDALLEKIAVARN
jgi:TRAP-type C4-dicarboxylate transport system substrate-binding protein